MENRRSIGVIISGIWLLLIFVLAFSSRTLHGILFLFTFLSDLIKSNKSNEQFYYSYFVQLGFLREIVYSLVGIGYLISGIGILIFRNWGRIVFFYSSGLWFIYLSISLISERCGFFGLGYFLAFVFYVIILTPLFIFFTRPKVKEQFK